MGGSLQMRHNLGGGGGGIAYLTLGVTIGKGEKPQKCVIFGRSPIFKQRYN
jgi:hypothetical protein